MTVKTHITFKDFLNFNIKNSFPRIIIFSLIILAIFGLNFSNAEYNTKEIFKSASVWFVAVFVFIIIRSYFRLKNAFHSNKKIQEEIIYTFTDEKVQTKGETFDSDFTWNTVHRVKETKDWFLIYQSKTTMNMVPKKYFSPSEIIELRNIIEKNNVKAKLRND
ncbi:YcxB family protein [Chryseobacterium sp. Ch-15]|uniref:YcxB family protein n=1 Tax=Chryseobacterium muglaense TaxID=2893752 RepID=A0A9Q3UV00_9FLAO|nr:YcxB family protein [Chryseobacterium muglaense]MBD3905687.1 YcxB family protein [Chryseobacterium muglaense]MCC9034215.1 YcxB family protein [Chryseobacterium muglaense]MCM2555624.1 YcxB family protein [Chryseobacterium muglaense]